jgi:hypothetical protein
MSQRLTSLMWSAVNGQTQSLINSNNPLINVKKRRSSVAAKASASWRDGGLALSCAPERHDGHRKAGESHLHLLGHRFGVKAIEDDEAPAL